MKDIDKEELVKLSLLLTPHITQTGSQFTELMFKEKTQTVNTLNLCFLEVTVFLLHIIDRHIISGMELEQRSYFMDNLVVNTKESIVNASENTPLEKEHIRLRFMQLYNQRIKEYASYKIRHPGKRPKGELFHEFGKVISSIIADIPDKESWDPIDVLMASGTVTLILYNSPILPILNKYLDDYQ